MFHLEGGSSGDKCFDTYHGPEAFSEPETANVRDFIMARYFINMVLNRDITEYFMKTHFLNKK